MVGIDRLSRVDRVELQPDYTLSCIDVYAQATHFFMQYSGLRLLETAALGRFRTWLSTLPSWAVEWCLSDLSVTSEPSTEKPDLKRFEISRDVFDEYILKSAVQIFGMIEIIDIEYPYWGIFTNCSINKPKDQALDTNARMSVYLLDASAYFATES